MPSPSYPMATNKEAGNLGLIDDLNQSYENINDLNERVGSLEVLRRSSYATLAEAIADLPAGGGTIHYDDGEYFDGDGLTISTDNVTLDGDNVTIYKAGDGPMFTITGSKFRINAGITLNGLASTYTGPGVVFDGEGTTYDARLKGDIVGTQEWAVDIGIGAAQRGRFGPSLFSTSNITASNANITSGTATLTATIAGGFQSPRDVGKYVLVRGALDAAAPTSYLLAKINSVTNSTTVVLDRNAGRTAVNEALEMHHPAFRFGGEYDAGVNGDRAIAGVFTEGFLLADLGGVQNLDISDTNSRGVVFSDPLCAKVAISGANRIATSGAPLTIRGTSHVVVGATLAGNIVLAADSENCTVLANNTPEVIDNGTDNATGLIGAWIAPSLLNSWVNYGSGLQAAQYRKNGDRVELRGSIKSGSVSTIFTLPAGFRPPGGVVNFNCPSNNGYDVANVEVQGDGDVVMLGYNAGGNNSFVSLDGISFSITA